MITTPNTAEEVAAILARQTTPVHISYDGTVHAAAHTLSLERLRNVIAYEPEEMIVSVEAGISLEALESLLATKNQWIPTLLANENPETTLGAAIENDHYHPRAASLGALRTAILGGTFCTTDGKLFKSGSRVVKSVAGYDIHRAFCGSRGRFGAIISVTLKVQPMPERIARFVAPVAARDLLFAQNPTMLARLGNELVTEFAGYEEDVAASTKLLINHITSTLDSPQWLAVLAQLRRAHIIPVISADAATMLAHVRAVFDPKHILV